MILVDQKQKNQILASFSIYSNSIKLFKTGNSGKLSCLNGIRVLSTTWIMLGHRFYETAIAPLDNIIDLVNVSK